MLTRLRISIINYFLKYSRFLKITKIHQLGNISIYFKRIKYY